MGGPRAYIGACLFLFAKVFVSGQSAFYNTGVIQKIEVNISQPDWDYMLDTARYGSDSHLMAQWVKVNGTHFDSVGIKYKGSSSYDSTFAKNPVHIELNTFKEQNYQGFTDIKLNNGYADPSMVREVLAYGIARNYMDAPQANFAQLYINGKYMGLYTNAESINKSFLSKHFYNNDGAFVKCNPNLTPSPGVKSNLRYIAPGDSSAYFNYYEMKSGHGWKSLAALCDSVSNKASNMASIIDVDRVIWMMAFNNVLVNLDSYNGVFAQNYYLYKDGTGRFCPITWDLNMSFGGFPFLGNSNSSLASLSIATQQSLALNAHATDTYWPLMVAIYNNPGWKKMYLAHAKTIVEEIFASNLYQTNYTTYKNLVDTAVFNDVNKFVTYPQFQTAFNNAVSVGSYSVPGIQTLMSARINYLQASADFTVTAPSIQQVGHTPGPQLNAPVVITASVSNASSVYLSYRFARSQAFRSVAMFDDGQHQDGAAGDHVYGSAFTLTANTAHYYIYAENANAAKFSPARAEHEFYTVKILNEPEAGEVVINEFLADNKSDVKNEFHLNEDWLELYNNSSNTLSLGGYYLSDDSGFMPKYAFPLNTTIGPNSYLLVWTDNITNATKNLHANFKLNNGGGKIVFSDGAYKVMDTYSYTAQQEDVSIGRCPDGNGGFAALKFPSYGMSNCVVGFDEIQEARPLSLYPNPASTHFIVKAENLIGKAFQVKNTMGREVYRSTLFSNTLVETNNWPSGVYFVTCGAFAGKIIVNN